MAKRKQIRNKKNLPTKKLELSPEEYALGVEFFEKRKQAKNPPKLKVVESAEGKKEIHPDVKAEDYLPVWCGARARATGTVDENLGGILIEQAVYASTSIAQGSEGVINSVTAAMAEIEPKDALEGMLVVQMVACHNQALSLMIKATEARSHSQVEKHLNLSNKLLRTFTAQLEALMRYRKKGQQTVRVEHVHVHEGAQAIVGTVNQGGSKNKPGE